MTRKKKKLKPIYRFYFGVLDSRTNDKIIDIKNLDVKDAKLAFRELYKKFK